MSRLPGALTVEGPPLPASTEARMLVAGRFVGLDETTAGDLQVGEKLSAMGGNRLEVIARRDALPDRRWFKFSDHQIESPLNAGLQVPALLRVQCKLLRCGVHRIGKTDSLRNRRCGE